MTANKLTVMNYTKNRNSIIFGRSQHIIFSFLPTLFLLYPFFALQLKSISQTERVLFSGAGNGGKYKAPARDKWSS